MRQREETREQQAERLRGEIAQQIAVDIETPLSAMRDVYEAAAKWLALVEYVQRVPGETTIRIITTPRRGFPDEPMLDVQIPDHISDTQTRDLLAEFAERIALAVAIKNEDDAIGYDDALGNPGRMAPKPSRERRPYPAVRSDVRPAKTITQSPKSVELDGALSCEGDEHVWATATEDGQPDAGQHCKCGAHRWNADAEFLRTGKHSRPTSPSVR